MPRSHRLHHPPVPATPDRTTPVTALCGEQEHALIKHPHVDPAGAWLQLP
jgi:hypothetical protein